MPSTCKAPFCNELEEDVGGVSSETNEENEKEAAVMGSRTLSLITEEDMLLEFEQMQKKMMMKAPNGKNLKIRVKDENAVGGEKNALENRDGNDATTTNGRGSQRSSSKDGGGDDDDDESPNDLENTVHLTDKFLTDRSRSGETTQIRFSTDASSRGTTFAAVSQKGSGRKEREDTFSVSIFDAGKLNSMLGKRGRGAIVASENHNLSNNDKVRVGNETFRSLGDLKVIEKPRIGMFSVIDGHGGAGAAAHCAASLHEMVFEQLSDRCEQMAEATAKARDKMMEMQNKRSKVRSSHSSSFEDMSGLSNMSVDDEGEESGFDELVKETIIAGFKRCDEDFFNRNTKDSSGACVAMALIWDDAVWIAHLGDCKIIAADFCSSQPLELLTETLTTDHIASNSSEASAVITRGGFIRAAANAANNTDAKGRENACNVFNNYILSACGGSSRGKNDAATSNNVCGNTGKEKNFICPRGRCDSIARVNGELAVTRSIGDRGCKPYISCEPDVRKTRFKRREKRDDEVFRNSNSKNKESFLLLTTDGAFGCGRVKDRDAAEVAANALLIESYQQHSPKASSSSWGQRARRACAEVISHVKKKGGKDDATVILIDIESAFNK